MRTEYSVFYKIVGIIALTLLSVYTFGIGMYAVSCLIIILIIFLSVSIYNYQQKPIKRIKQMIATIRHGDLNISFPTDGKGEEREMNRMMNEALSSFRTRLYNKALIEAEIQAWQKLIRVLTHEIMNSIAPIISLSETTVDRSELPDSKEKEYEILLQAMKVIHRRSKGLSDFVQNYRKLTGFSTPNKELVSVFDLLEGIKKLMGNIKIPVKYSSYPFDFKLSIDRSMIEQVLINLLSNASEACKNRENPHIKVEAYIEGTEQIIMVSDNGSGILPEVLDKVFVPFYTTKSKGSGIGLSICRQIMNLHGGNIVLESQPNKGTVVFLRFLF